MGRSKELFHHMREKNIDNDYLEYYFFYKKKSNFNNNENDSVQEADNRLLI
jgi:hypothetical protein